MTTYVRVKAYQQSVGRECMHCNRPATTTVTRRLHRFTMRVWFCEDHAHLRRTTWPAFVSSVAAQ
jgi:hypothetical protein